MNFIFFFLLKYFTTQVDQILICQALRYSFEVPHTGASNELPNTCTYEFVEK